MLHYKTCICIGFFRNPGLIILKSKWLNICLSHHLSLTTWKCLRTYSFYTYYPASCLNFYWIHLKSSKCKLGNAFQIQKILLKDEFVEEDIVETEHLVNKYLQLVDEHAPELKRKVKTHLLCHLVIMIA